MPVRIGFIGTGGIAGNHFNNLEQIKDAQLVAFADIAAERAEAAARRFEGRAYTDTKKMLEKEELDAVYVCVPPFAHSDAELLAVKKGCALFVEKPVALNLKWGEKVAAAIESAGVVSSVGYHYRYNEASAHALRLLTQKGAPTVGLAYGRWMNAFVGVPWWRKMNQSGGQLVEQATHLIDLMRYLVGDVKRVYCVASQREMHKDFPGSDIPDATALTMEFENGVVGYAACTSMIGMTWDTGVDLFVRDAKYQVLSNTLRIENTNFETHVHQYNNNPYVAEDTAFVQSVKKKKPSGILCNYADGLKTLRVTLAANKSAQTGKPVNA